MSETMEMDINELRAKAKELGYNKAHLAGAEKLMEEIAKREGVSEEGAPAETQTEPVRKTAPRMSVENIIRDNGLRTVMELDKQNPDFKHMLQPKDVDMDVLAAKGLEFIGKTIGNEIVCRTTRESFDAWQNAQNEQAHTMMQSIDPDGEQIQKHTVQPKTPKDA